MCGVGELEKSGKTLERKQIQQAAIVLILLIVNFMFMTDFQWLNFVLIRCRSLQGQSQDRIWQMSCKLSSVLVVSDSLFIQILY